MNDYIIKNSKVLAIFINVVINVILLVNIFHTFFYIEEFIIVLINFLYGIVLLLILFLIKLISYLLLIKIFSNKRCYDLTCDSIWIDLSNTTAKNTNFDVKITLLIEFFQCSKVSVTVETINSKSYSYNEKIRRKCGDFIIDYNYENYPVHNRTKKLLKHDGKARLIFDANGELKNFEYFNASNERLSTLRNFCVRGKYNEI